MLCRCRKHQGSTQLLPYKSTPNYFDTLLSAQHTDSPYFTNTLLKMSEMELKMHKIL